MAGCDMPAGPCDAICVTYTKHQFAYAIVDSSIPCNLTLALFKL